MSRDALALRLRRTTPYGPAPNPGAGLFLSLGIGPVREALMAKGQRRSNREIRKPKMDKTAKAETTSTFLPKGTTVTIGTPKKKG
ncbi:hypothetical protein [Consotaella aegiceratis]|uniref:hypothetical protein n=1 Tax=Consotaella aegiceratis TaxID=3097961 RepID=UPI002F411A8B